MSLKSNLPFAYLTEEQNDWFAKVPGSVEPQLTTAQQLAVACNFASRVDYTWIEIIVNLLEKFSDLTVAWKPKSPTLCLRTYGSAHAIEAIRATLHGVSFDTWVEEICNKAGLTTPESWGEELRRVYAGLDYLVTQLLDGHSDSIGDLKIVKVDADDQQVNAYVQYKRLVFALSGCSPSLLVGH